MTIRHKKFGDGTSPAEIPGFPLIGGRPAKRSRVHSVHSGQDSIIGHGRRTLMRVSLGAAEEFEIVSLSATSALQRYPLKGIPRDRARAKIRLTPGYFPELRVLALPSGALQKFNLGTYIPDGAGGQVRIEVEFDNGVDPPETVTTELTPPTSLLTNNAEPPVAQVGAAWNALRYVKTGLITPEGVFQDVSVLEKWADNVTVTMKIQFVGSIRPVDVSVSEAPAHFANKYTDTSWATHAYTGADGQGLQTYPSDYPVQRASEAVGGDPTRGTLQLTGVPLRQAQRFGPVIYNFTAHDEATADVSVSQQSAFSVATTTFTHIPTPTATAYDADTPGVSASSGGSSRQYDTAGKERILRDKNAAIPVRVFLEARLSAGGATGTVRVQSAGYHYVEIPVTSVGLFADHEATLYVRAGTRPEDISNIAVFGKTTLVTSLLEVRNISIDFGGDDA